MPFGIQESSVVNIRPLLSHDIIPSSDDKSNWRLNHLPTFYGTPIKEVGKFWLADNRYLNPPTDCTNPGYEY